MKKLDIDDILNELGIDPNKPGEAPTRQRARPMPFLPGPEATPGPNYMAPPGASRNTGPSASSPPDGGFLPNSPSNQPGVGRSITPRQADPSDAEIVSTRPPTPPSSGGIGDAMTSIHQPETPSALTNSELTDMLLSSGAATQQQLAGAQQIMRQSQGKRLLDVLVEQGATEAKVQECIAAVSGMTFEPVDLTKALEGGFDGKLIQRLTLDFCQQHMVLPLRQEGLRPVIGVTRPDTAFLSDEIRRRLGVPAVKLVLVTGFDVRGALEIVGGPMKSQGEDDVNDILSSVQETDVQVEKKSESEVDLERAAGENPVIRYVNYIIQQAVKEGASDIHIEPGDKKMKVRFRIDGELYEMMQPPPAMSAAITSRIKIIANLDISERRMPQDGRIRCAVAGRKLDLRVSTLPCGYGEKVVMRILDTRSINVKLEDLGFDENTMQLWRGLINAPHGIVLVTGPTGSGKTTTLYSSLRTLDKTSMNISTVEDPIEYHLDGITQTQMHDKIGMNFARALKALLRQDPDVIMLGEIRDQETAVTAVQAALTGHLVLSTLHTNDAPSSITRLVNIGLEPFLVAAAVNGVLAQRLLRKLCPVCRIEKEPSEEMKEFLELQGMPIDKLWTGKGCDKCRNSGYSGRVGIYELLVVDDQLRDFIVRSPNVAELRRLCAERGMTTLRADGLKKTASGKTSVEEVLRVTESAM
ncbi:MAG: Flp pilus assembly complex ATPase component TadA [Phycisphaerales bacterium]|nr:Flp pilus assembly complex ATPase component TadA [Phycisphaerales bacterium]